MKTAILMTLRKIFPKLEMPEKMLRQFARRTATRIAYLLSQGRRSRRISKPESRHASSAETRTAPRAGA
jgi:hypothetical protein